MADIGIFPFALKTSCLFCCDHASLHKPLWTHPEPWMLPGHFSEQLTVGFSVSQQSLLVVTTVLTNVEPWLSSSSFMSQICHDHTGSVRNLHGAFLLFTFTYPYVCLLCLFIRLAALFTVVQGKLTTPWAGNIFVHLSCGSDPNVRVASDDRVHCPFFMAITAKQLPDIVRHGTGLRMGDSRGYSTHSKMIS